MRKSIVFGALVMAVVCVPVWAQSSSISGVIKDNAGKSLGGVMVSAFDPELEMNVTVFTKDDGSFKIDGLAKKDHNVRARLIGLEDQWVNAVGANSNDVGITMTAASPEALVQQATGDKLFAQLKWDNKADRENFKMMCMYCHQVGTMGFRTPEEPVDWDTMVRRMQGFGGLYKHTQDSLVTRLMETYTADAMEEWPEFHAEPAPTGRALDVTITEWDQGRQDDCMIHDLEVGADERLVYTVDMTNDAIMELNTITGERKTFGVPGGKDPNEVGTPRKGPHSIELSPVDGSMWITLALSGEMARFDPKSTEWTVVSGHPTRKRGAYPHTLRVDQKGRVWYTDAGTNSVFKLDPSNGNKVTEYPLLSANQTRGGGTGEAGGITPYGISVGPDGVVWATKLNGNRLVKIDGDEYDKYFEMDKQVKDMIASGKAETDAAVVDLKTKADAQKEKGIKEYEPPFKGPRRHEVAPDGIVWVPGFGSGVISAFDPKTETWKVWDMPLGMDEIPYALSVNPKTGQIWVCGTGSDTMSLFDPKKEEWTTYRMPSRVTYTREVEFTSDGSVFVCNSNYPARHIERGRGSVIKIQVADGGKDVAGD